MNREDMLARLAVTDAEWATLRATIRKDDDGRFCLTDEQSDTIRILYREKTEIEAALNAP